MCVFVQFSNLQNLKIAPSMYLDVMWWYIVVLPGTLFSCKRLEMKLGIYLGDLSCKRLEMKLGIYLGDFSCKRLELKLGIYLGDFSCKRLEMKLGICLLMIYICLS